MRRAVSERRGEERAKTRVRRGACEHARSARPMSTKRVDGGVDASRLRAQPRPSPLATSRESIRLGYGATGSAQWAVPRPPQSATSYNARTRSATATCE
jgi:hypothetical protein